MIAAASKVPAPPPAGVRISTHSQMAEWVGSSPAPAHRGGAAAAAHPRPTIPMVAQNTRLPNSGDRLV